MLADDAQADGTRAANVTGFWRGRCAREPERGQPRPGMAAQLFREPPPPGVYLRHPRFTIMRTLRMAHETQQTWGESQTCTIDGVYAGSNKQREAEGCVLARQKYSHL